MEWWIWLGMVASFTGGFALGLAVIIRAVKNLVLGLAGIPEHHGGVLSEMDAADWLLLPVIVPLLVIGFIAAFVCLWVRTGWRLGSAWLWG